MDHLPLGDRYSIDEIAPPDSVVGKSLSDLALPRRFGIQVLAIRDVLTGEMHVNPGADFRIKESDALIVLGDNQQMERLRKL